jgi:transcriptional regulator with XRE-family HTH domain
MNSFKVRLSEAMATKNISQSELSRLTGIGRNSISDYLNGKYEAKQDKVFLLAKYLNVNEAWLLGYDVDKERSLNSTTSSSKKFETLAAHLDGELTDDQWNEVLKYAQYIIDKDK